jgi:hypothetical protein
VRKLSEQDSEELAVRFGCRHDVNWELHVLCFEEFGGNLAKPISQVHVLPQSPGYLVLQLVCLCLVLLAVKRVGGLGDGASKLRFELIA